MTAQSSMHFHIEQAKERLNEIDATLASLESETGKVQAASRARADRLIAELRQRRGEFQEAVKALGERGEAAQLRAKAQLDAEWNRFETDVKTFVETFSGQVEQQKATFQGRAAAQLKAWREASDNLHAAAAVFAGERRADIDAAVKQMRAGASEAEANFQNLAKAGTASWAALSGALAQSRAAFDGALRAAANAFEHAGRAGGADKPSAEPPR